MQSELEEKLLAANANELSAALDELYGPQRHLQPSHTRKRTPPLAVVGVAAALLVLGIFGFRGSGTARASVERSRIERAIVELPDFFESVEDGDNRTAALTQILVALPQPKFDENRGVWADAALHVYGFLAVEASRAGQWQLSRVYEAEARSLLSQVSPSRSFEASCVVEYAEGRRRHEEALSNKSRRVPALKKNGERLTEFLNFIGPIDHRGSHRNLVALARLHSLAAVSFYKTGAGRAANALFADANRALNAVEPAERGVAWNKAFARNSADWSLLFAIRGDFDGSREKLSVAIQRLEQHEDDPYLLGLLYANRADTWQSQYRFSDVTDEAVVALTGSEIADRRAARRWFAEPAQAEESVNRRENRTLNLSRLALTYARLRDWSSALETVNELAATVDGVDSFVNPQVGTPTRIVLNLVLAGDTDRSQSERLSSVYLAMTRLTSFPYAFETKFLDVYDALAQRVPSSVRQEIEQCLTNTRDRTEAER